MSNLVTGNNLSIEHFQAVHVSNRQIVQLFTDHPKLLEKNKPQFTEALGIYVEELRLGGDSELHGEALRVAHAVFNNSVFDDVLPDVINTNLNRKYECFEEEDMIEEMETAIQKRRLASDLSLIQLATLSALFCSTQYLKQTDSKRKHLIQVACDNGHVEVGHYLIEQGNMKKEENYREIIERFLVVACEKGKLSIIEPLVKDNNPLRRHIQKDDSALRAAFEQKHLDVVVYLQSQGASFHAKDEDELAAFLEFTTPDF